jgi:hypothetical protein
MPVDTSNFQLGPWPWEPDSDVVSASNDNDDDLRRSQHISAETHLLEEMRQTAEAYIRSWSWAPPIKEMLLAYGIGGIIALYLIKFKHKVPKWGDEEMWVVVGDMPSTYFVTDDAPTPAWAFDIYCELVEDWAHAVLSGASRANVYPLDAPPTREYADALLSRVRFIREDLIPTLD